MVLVETLQSGKAEHIQNLLISVYQFDAPIKEEGVQCNQCANRWLSGPRKEWYLYLGLSISLCCWVVGQSAEVGRYPW